MGLSSLWIHQRYTPRVWLNDSWQMGCDIAACVASDVPTVKCQFYLSCDIDSGQITTTHHKLLSACLSAHLQMASRVVPEGRDPCVNRFERLLHGKPARTRWLYAAMTQGR